MDLSGRHYTAQSRTEFAPGQSVMVRVAENRGGSALLEIIKPDIPNVTAPGGRDLARLAKSADIPADPLGLELARQILRRRLPLALPRWPALHRALASLPGPSAQADPAVIERAIQYSTVEPGRPSAPRLAAYLAAFAADRPSARRAIDLREPSAGRIRDLMRAVDAPRAAAERSMDALDGLLDGLRAIKIPRALPGRDLEWPVTALTPEGEVALVVRVEEDESEPAVASRVRPARHLWLKLNLPSLGALDIRVSQWHAPDDQPRIDIAFWAENAETARRLRTRLSDLPRHESYETGSVAVHDGLWREDE